MNNPKVNAGKIQLSKRHLQVDGRIVSIGDDSFYRIANFDEMAPFFMSIVSSSDHWMFISSNGSLSAGRKNPDTALFPYYTDDRIHDSKDTTGSKSIFYIKKETDLYLWEPFSDRYAGVYRTERNIYKNEAGNHLIFEEKNIDLGVCFQYSWRNSERFGFIRKSTLVNESNNPLEFYVLDGIRNLLPWGANRQLQLEFSTLLDGYKKSELITETGLALYLLSSILTDKAEPSEALRATIAWSAGLATKEILLSEDRIDSFLQTMSVSQENDSKGKRGAFLINTHFRLEPGANKSWYIVADVNKDHQAVIELNHLLADAKNLPQLIEKEIEEASMALDLKTGRADGVQVTADNIQLFRHRSNTLFNIMRGGIFAGGYEIDKSDFMRFLKNANRQVAEKVKPILNLLPDIFSSQELLQKLDGNEPVLEKLVFEYLPLTFSRRHGDPSRPWNMFSIDLKDDRGEEILNYQGNWRDIYQNWEALAFSFPEYIEKMITKFVNASTADGYNPYRVTRDGFDWEEPEPQNPWANIGYWGDHQIIYLLKLLESSAKYHPGKLHSLLTKEIFAYANVPYRIKPYEALCRDPHNTIDFDFDLNDIIREKVLQLGSDGKFILDENDQIYLVNLGEKLLLPMLVKLSNFVPEAGIWMNTQRPEWNDANNALVGFGASMVTLYYLRNYVAFLKTLFADDPIVDIRISEAVYEFFSEIKLALDNNRYLLSAQLSDTDRKKLLDELGMAGSKHRLNLYENGFSGKRTTLDVAEIHSLLDLSLAYIDQSIKANKRDDNLYHSYNLIQFSENAVSILHLYEMLEGQVAILSSSYLTAEESILILDALRGSTLYNERQNSYMLYPNRDLPRFMEKNVIPKALLEDKIIQESLSALIEKQVIRIDLNGDPHFHSDYRNGRILKEAMKPHFNDETIQKWLDLYEAVFEHKYFTGRSGAFFKYEGLGSIYWHMVSKLLLAVLDTFNRVRFADIDAAITDRLKVHFHEIKAGIGAHKNPGVYGAFPTDAYSHTPDNLGAQQPGMTGQVKEDILSRFGELGVGIKNGHIEFDTSLLNKDELLADAQPFCYYDLDNQKQTVMLGKGMLGFTICQVPVIYREANQPGINIIKKDDSEEAIPGLILGIKESRSVFLREGQIKRIMVSIKLS